MAFNEPGLFRRGVAVASAIVSVAFLAQPAAAFDPPPARSWTQPAGAEPTELPPAPPPPPPPIPPEFGPPPMAASEPPAAGSGEPVSPDDRRWIVPTNETRAATVNTQGSFGLELAAGVLASLIGGGLVVLGIVQLDEDLDTRTNCSTSCSALLVTGLGVMIFGPPTAVTIAGNASGGKGSFGWSLVGTLAGTVLSVPGMVAGAIIGYRASAPDETTLPAVSLAPTPDLHGLQLRVGARF